MKKLILCSIVFILLQSCSKTEDFTEEMGAFPRVDLGLSANNEYPDFPYTFRAMGSNEWFYQYVADTLKVYRRDVVYTDSGDHIEYTFLVKSKRSLQPLNVKRTRFSAVGYTDLFDNIIGSPPQVMYNKSIDGFKLQEFVHKEILACEITTQKGDFSLQQVMIDKIWIDLSKVYKP